MNIEDIAKLLFYNPPPKPGGKNKAYPWEDQPENIKEVFRQKARDWHAARSLIEKNLEGLKLSILHFEKGCRDCADEEGICPRNGIACGYKKDAIDHVMRALLYYLEHPHFIGDTTD